LKEATCGFGASRDDNDATWSIRLCGFIQRKCW